MSDQENPDSVMGWPDDIPIHEAVMEAIGAGSTCWSNLDGAGVFQSERAAEIGEELIALLQRKQIAPDRTENPDSLAEQCECGHERGDHFRDVGTCMVETENETWACACPEFQMAESPDSLIPNEKIAEQLLAYICPAGEPWTGDDPTADHGHTQCYWIGLAIQRLRETDG